MNKSTLLLSLLVFTMLMVATVGTAFAAEPQGRGWGKAVEGEPGVWRAHFALLGGEGSGELWGATVSGAAQGGGLGGHSSGR
jgi:hypothetical protein